MATKFSGTKTFKTASYDVEAEWSSEYPGLQVFVTHRKTGASGSLAVAIEVGVLTRSDCSEQKVIEAEIDRILDWALTLGY